MLVVVLSRDDDGSEDYCTDRTYSSIIFYFLSQFRQLEVDVCEEQKFPQLSLISRILTNFSSH